MRFASSRTIRPVLFACVAAAALVACSEPMEQPAPPEGAEAEAADASDDSKTAKIPVPEIRDAEGLSPRETEEAETPPLFDPRSPDAGMSKFAAGAATPPDAAGEGNITGKAAGSFTAPGANETAWLVVDTGPLEASPPDGGEACIVLVSVGGQVEEVSIADAGFSIVAAPDTNRDGLTELLLYTETMQQGVTVGRARLIGLRGGEVQTVETWDNLLTDACDSPNPGAGLKGSVLMQDEDTGAITAEPFQDGC